MSPSLVVNIVVLVSEPRLLNSPSSWVIGLPVGWLLAWLAVKPLAGVVSELLVPIEGTGVSLPPWLLLVALVSGTLTAMLASLVPAVNAAGEEPADAVRRVPRRGGWAATLTQVGAVLVLLAGGALVVLYRERLPGTTGMFAGIIFLFVGGLAATPVLAGLVGRAVQPVFRYVLGLEGRLAAQDSIVLKGLVAGFFRAIEEKDTVRLRCLREYWEVTLPMLANEDFLKV